MNYSSPTEGMACIRLGLRNTLARTCLPKHTHGARGPDLSTLTPSELTPLFSHPLEACPLGEHSLSTEANRGPSKMQVLMLEPHPGKPRYRLKRKPYCFLFSTCQAMHRPSHQSNPIHMISTEMRNEEERALEGRRQQKRQGRGGAGQEGKNEAAEKSRMTQAH